MLKCLYTTDRHFIPLVCTFIHAATPNREHVFHARFPDTWTQGDLNNHFNKFGPVQTRWIDSCSAFVLLSHRENAPAVLGTIDKRKNVEVSTFAAYASRAEQDDVSYLILLLAGDANSVAPINTERQTQNKSIRRTIRTTTMRRIVRRLRNDHAQRYHRI